MKGLTLYHSLWKTLMSNAGVFKKMNYFGMKKWPTPFHQPLMPFFIAGGLVFYGVYRIADAMMQSEQYINDIRNPRARYGPKSAH